MAYSKAKQYRLKSQNSFAALQNLNIVDISRVWEIIKGNIRTFT